jgi:hypothetical protein
VVVKLTFSSPTDSSAARADLFGQEELSRSESRGAERSSLPDESSDCKHTKPQNVSSVLKKNKSAERLINVVI